MKYLLAGQHTERLLFRLIQETDYNAWLPFHEDPSTSLHWTSPKETPEIACRKWFDKQFARYRDNLGGMNALIEKQTGHLIGHCGLLVQTVDEVEELEIAYSLLPAFWNRGYAKEAAAKCRDMAFENKYAASLISIISVTNIASEKVAVSIGMKKDKATVYNANNVNIFRMYSPFAQ